MLPTQSSLLGLRYSPNQELFSAAVTSKTYRSGSRSARKELLYSLPFKRVNENSWLSPSWLRLSLRQRRAERVDKFWPNLRGISPFLARDSVDRAENGTYPLFFRRHLRRSRAV